MTNISGIIGFYMGSMCEGSQPRVYPPAAIEGPWWTSLLVELDGPGLRAD